MHDAVGHCRALSEVLVALFLEVKVAKLGNLSTVRKKRSDLDRRSNVRCAVLLLQELLISKGMKEMSKAGIRFQQLIEIFSKYGRGLSALLVIQTKGLKAPLVTKNKNILRSLRF